MKFGADYKYTELLGSKSYNASGHIVGAKSILNLWYLARDPKGRKDKSFAAASTDLNDDVDDLTYGLEESFLTTSEVIQEEANRHGIKLLFANDLG